MIKYSELKKHADTKIKSFFKEKNFKKKKYNYVKELGDQYLSIWYDTLNYGNLAIDLSINIGSHKVWNILRHISPDKYDFDEGIIFPYYYRLESFSSLDLSTYLEIDSFLTHSIEYIKRITELLVEPGSKIYLIDMINSDLNSDSFYSSLLIFIRLNDSSKYQKFKNALYNQYGEEHYMRNDLDLIIDFLEGHTNDQINSIAEQPNVIESRVIAKDANRIEILTKIKYTISNDVDGFHKLMFDRFPPSDENGDDIDLEIFNNFDDFLSKKLGVEVLWDDREVFLIPNMTKDLEQKVIACLAQFERFEQNM